MVFPFVPSELTGRTAIVSFFPAGSADCGMSTVVTPWFGSWPMPELRPLKNALLKCHLPAFYYHYNTPVDFSQP